MVRRRFRRRKFIARCPLCKNPTTKHCKYCGNWYCDQHYIPRGFLEKRKNAKLIKEYDPTLGHACYEYNVKARHEEAEQAGRWERTLDKLLERPQETIGEKSPESKPILPEHISEEPEEHPQTTNWLNSIRNLLDNFGISLYSFIKYTVILVILLTLINLFFVGKIDLTPIILRSLGLVFLGYIIAFGYRKTKYKIPWKWIIAGIIVVSIAYMYYTGNYSSLKIFDKLIGVENFTQIIIPSLSNITQALNSSSDNGNALISQITTGSPVINPNPTSSITQPNIDTSSLETQIHNLINVQRQNNGISSLQFDAQLASIARFHSKDMATQNYFAHNSLDGKTPTDRAASSGYSCYKNYGTYYTSGIAENIALTPIGDVIGCGSVYSISDVASCTVNGWMNSPGHRQNILTSTYDREGIGVAVSSDNKVYITEDFC